MWPLTFGLTNVATLGGGTSPPPVPSTPANFTATPGDAEVTLTWDASTGATGYKIYRDSSLLVSLGAVITYEDDDVINGTEYSYTISATNSNGESAQSAPETATPNIVR